MGEVILELRGVRFRYPRAERESVCGVDLQVRPGELLGIVGPNGSGKTTLLRLLTGTVRPDHGVAKVLGREMGSWKRRELARLVAVVAQREEPVFPLKVEQAVLLGRYPHMSALGAPGPGDWRAVADALRRCDATHLRDRWIATLSGGEWQRVRVARALAQQPRALILDEATANLDIGHEMEVFELMWELVHHDGIAGVFVTHHVNLAARFGDRILIIDDGATRAAGAPHDVLTREVLEDVFDWPVDVVTWHGVPQFVPKRRGE